MISTLIRRSSASFHSSRSHLPGLAALEVLEQRRLLSVTSAAEEHEHHEDQQDHVRGDIILPAQVQRFAVDVEAEGHVRDISGETYFYDPAPAAHAPTGEPSAADGGTGGDSGTGGGGLAGGVPAFHSNPSSPYKVFLDFDGHVVDGTLWNNYNDGNPIHAQPYSQDEDIFNLSDAELASIEEIFLRVAEDFAPFDVDVTTEDPGSAAFETGAQALRVLISTDVDSTAMGGTGNRWFEGAGGVAYLGSWRWTSDTPVWAFENNLGNGFAKYVAEAASHEAGHAFDLTHDGQDGGDGAYYRGHGTGATSWAPIMGVGYSRSLTQWSKGEYNGANNQQDDLAVITDSRNNVTFRADDHGGSASTATSLSGVQTGTSSSPLLQFKGSGIIGNPSDVDAFRLDLTDGDGRLTLKVAPEVYLGGYGNLDAKAVLRNAAGNVVASANPVDAIDAFLDLQLSAGVYTLSVNGVGKGDPLSTGYTDYGSLGQYDIIADYAYDGQEKQFTIDVNGTPSQFELNAFSSYSNQDVTPGLSILDDANGFSVFNNSWKKLDLPYNVTADTMIEFDVSTTDAGEMLVVGFDDDNVHNDGAAKRQFQLGGWQTWSAAHQQFNGTPADGSTRRVSIPAGQFITGDMKYLTFIMDDDADASGNMSISNFKIYEKQNSFDGFIEQNGLVVMEAENATGGAAGTGAASGSTWQSVSDSAASGGTALVATPNTGVNTGDSTIGARHDYAVRFTTPGTWYAWVRILGETGNDDSVHIGVDGNPLSFGHWGIGNNSGQWTWMNSIGFGALQFDVPAAGDHVFNLWMREDGVKADKIVLTRDPNFRPTGTGPGQTGGVPPFSQVAIGDGSSLFASADEDGADADLPIA